MWPSAAERVSERPTDVRHPPRGELSHPPPERRTLKRVHVVEVDDTVGRADAIGDGLARQHEDRPIFTGGRRKTDLTPLIAQSDQ